VFSGNQVGGGEYARGAGINIQNPHMGVDSRVERTLVSDNSIASTYGFGAGLRVAGSTFALVDSTVAGNSVIASSKARGGAIFMETSQMQIVNSTLSGNEAVGQVNEGGGGIMALSESGGDPASLSIFNSTIAGNRSPNSDSGGILFKNETPDAAPIPALFESSLIAGNQGINGFDEIGVASSSETTISIVNIVADFSLLQGNVNLRGDSTIVYDTTSKRLLGADPLLQPLAWNGGPTPTEGLAPNSPAIDQGSNMQNLDYDQRGAPYARVVGDAADIGAIEFDPERIFANGFE